MSHVFRTQFWNYSNSSWILFGSDHLRRAITPSCETSDDSATRQNKASTILCLHRQPLPVQRIRHKASQNQSLQSLPNIYLPPPPDFLGCETFFKWPLQTMELLETAPSLAQLHPFILSAASSLKLPLQHCCSSQMHINSRVRSSVKD